MRELLVVGTGGFLGAVARFWLSGWVHRWVGAGFPWGTLTALLDEMVDEGMMTLEKAHIIAYRHGDASKL